MAITIVGVWYKSCGSHNSRGIVRKLWSVNNIVRVCLKALAVYKISHIYTWFDWLLKPVDNAYLFIYIVFFLVFFQSQRSSASPVDRDKYRPRSHSPSDVVEREPVKKRRPDNIKEPVSTNYIGIFSYFEKAWVPHTGHVIK